MGLAARNGTPAATMNQMDGLRCGWPHLNIRGYEADSIKTLLGLVA